MDTRTALTTARAELAELAARVSPIDPRADVREVRELYRLRRLVIDLEAKARREAPTTTTTTQKFGRDLASATRRGVAAGQPDPREMRRLGYQWNGHAWVQAAR